MAGLKSSIMVVFFAMMVASMQFQPSLAQTRHIVGDSLGWTIPPGNAVAYTNWASRQTFRVGDVLLFNFTTGQHNVAEVSPAAYGPCTSSNPISLTTTGPASVTLTTPGTHYYICTVGSHCQIGQKVAVNVSAATTTTTTATPAPAPAPVFPPTTTPTPTPAPAPFTSVRQSSPTAAPSPMDASPPAPVNSVPSPAGSTTPSPVGSTPSPTTRTTTDPQTPPADNAAPSFAAVVPVTFLAIGLAFFY